LTVEVGEDLVDGFAADPRNRNVRADVVHSQHRECINQPCTQFRDRYNAFSACHGPKPFFGYPASSGGGASVAASPRKRQSECPGKCSEYYLGLTSHPYFLAAFLAALFAAFLFTRGCAPGIGIN